MYRFTFIFIFIFNVLLFTTCAFAQNDLHENLYIPEGAFDASVKLPPIKLGTYENMPTIKRASSPQNQSKSTLPSNSSSSISKALPNPSSSSSLDKLKSQDKPDYKEKYDKYLDDLKIIGETGKMPNNPELNADLKNMNSDKKFEIE